MATPNYLFPEIAEGQASKHLTHNEALRMVEVALGTKAQSAPINTPPTSPVEGTLYIVGTAPTGAWAGKANNLALRINGFWLFVPPTVELAPIYSKLENNFYHYNGSAWVALVLSAAGSNTTASNVGVGGLGLFKQKTGETLEFKTINAASTKIIVSNDAANSEVDIDVDESKLSLNNIGGAIDDAKHGARGGGNLHAIATTSTNGFMSSADKNKLDGISGTGAASPIASSATSGTVKIDVTQPDPVVYTKTTSDSLLDAKEPKFNILPTSKGGTGLDATPAANKLLLGTGSGYELVTLTQGSNITITNSNGVLTISSNATSGTALARNTVTVTTGVLISGQIENLNPNLGKSFDLYQITTDNPAWVRVYYTSADRSLDSGRADTTEVEDFNPNVKIIHEVFTTLGKLSVSLDPIRRGASYESIPSPNIAVAIKNMSGITTPITVSFTKLTLEN